MWHWLSDAIGVFVVLVLSVWFVIGLGLVYFLAWIWWRVRSEECRVRRGHARRVSGLPWDGSM